jgi:hypothetical protein
VLVLHPFGALSISQRALPLALTLDKIGNQPPDDVNLVDITAATTGAATYPLSVSNESFAPAQFQNMSDADKLSRPSYQQLKGGVIIGAAGGPQSSKMTDREIDYQVTIIDKESVRPTLRMKAIPGLFHGFLSGAAVSRSTLSYRTKSQLGLANDKVTVSPDGYTVASTQNNKPFDASSTFTSEAMASDYMKRQVAANPVLAGSVHVLPNHEVAP